MKKYFSVFKISFAQEFAYKVNFVMWRVRNVMQIFLVFFLWDAIFQDPGRQVFGYDRSKILTYVFGILILRAFVTSARSVDVASEIGDGTLTNHLLKPVSYFKYWVTRDVSSKLLNLIFVVFEATILYILLKPPFYFQTNFINLASFLVLLVMAVGLYFFLLFMTSFVAFWTPEMSWPVRFLFMGIVLEFLSGAIFPLDIFPEAVKQILYLSPFPYLLFFPLQVYLGTVSGLSLVKGMAIAFFWFVALWFGMNAIWKKGLKAYRAEGR